MKILIILIVIALICGCMHQAPAGTLTYEKTDGVWKLKYFTVTLEKGGVFGSKDESIRSMQKNIEITTKTLNEYLEGK